MNRVIFFFTFFTLLLCTFGFLPFLFLKIGEKGFFVLEMPVFIDKNILINLWIRVLHELSTQRVFFYLLMTLKCENVGKYTVACVLFVARCVWILNMWRKAWLTPYANDISEWDYNWNGILEKCRKFKDRRWIKGKGFYFRFKCMCSTFENARWEYWMLLLSGYFW